MEKTYEMRPTKRAVIDVGRLCNTKCKCCYYRYETWNQPDPKKRLTWMKTEVDLKKEVIEALKRGCDTVDFTGGEPTIHPAMASVIQFCVQRGLEPRIITNGQAGDNKMYELIGAGCKDFLLSIHDVGKRLDKIMQKEGAWKNMLECIAIIKERGARFSVNTVAYKDTYIHLPKIAEEVVRLKPYLWNIINCNPPYSSTVDNLKQIQAKVSASKEYIEEAICIASNVNIWTNLRYFPMCVLVEELRPHIVNHPQVMFDFKNEWDYGTFPKSVENYLKFGREAFQYKSDAQDGICGKCGIRNVCGGVNLGYRQAHGEEELKPTENKEDYPFFYRSLQETVDIIIPVYKVKHNLSRLMEELIHKTVPPYNLIFIQKEQSAARNRNTGLNKCTSEFVIMCDDDIAELPFAWNKKFIDRLLYNPEIMAISARLLNEDGTVGVNSANNFETKTDYEEVSMIPTACCCFRLKDVVKTGTRFDERFIKSGWEDTAFFETLKRRCQKKGLGTKIIIDNQIPVVHLHTATGYDEWFEYNKQVFQTICKEEDNGEEETL